MSEQDLERWDEKYSVHRGSPLPPPASWLSEAIAGLPSGRAWDVGCGVGQNSWELARAGWEVDATDISAVGLSIAAEQALPFPERIRWIQADLDCYFPPRRVYDLVVVFRFLDRKRLPGLIEQGLRPGGRIVYETFVAGQMERSDNHLTNSAFVLNRGELPKLFPTFKQLFYQEVALEDRTVARLIAEKRG